MPNPSIWHVKSIDLACRVLEVGNMAPTDYESGVNPDLTGQIQASGPKIDSFESRAVGTKLNN